ncbi:hypothetical protein DA717_15230, partial [Piscirickettsiaceae bacterium NZ-RLO2]
MLIIKPIKANQGDVASKGEDVVLTTGGFGGTYGSCLKVNAAIVAHSESGYGLFHLTGRSSQNFIKWLKELKRSLGADIQFSIIRCEPW